MGGYGGFLGGRGGYNPVAGDTSMLFPRTGGGNLDPVPGTEMGGGGLGGVPGQPGVPGMPPGGPALSLPGGPGGGVPMMPGGGGGMPGGDLQRGALMDALKQYIGGGR